MVNVIYFLYREMKEFAEESKICINTRNRE